MGGHGKIILYFEDGISFKELNSLLLSLKSYDDFLEHQLSVKSDLSSIKNWEPGYYYSNELYFEKDVNRDLSNRELEDYYYFHLGIPSENEQSTDFNTLVLSGNSGSAEFYLTYNNKKLASYLHSQAVSLSTKVKIIAGHDLDVNEIKASIDNVNDLTEGEREEMQISIVL